MVKSFTQIHMNYRVNIYRLAYPVGKNFSTYPFVFTLLGLVLFQTYFRFFTQLDWYIIEVYFNKPLKYKS
jgi:hypothetical protein